MTNPLLLLGGGGTSDNLDQLASNDGLTGSVEENLVLVDHVSCVLGGVLLKVSISVVRAKEDVLTSMALRRAEISQA